jgi:hypothetical protein
VTASSPVVTTFFGEPETILLPDRIVVFRAPIPAALVREMLASGPCLYCHGPAETVDHIYPVAQGGNSEKVNLAPACSFCNMSKRNRLWVPGCRIRKPAGPPPLSFLDLLAGRRRPAEAKPPTAAPSTLRPRQQRGLDVALREVREQ